MTVQKNTFQGPSDRWTLRINKNNDEGIYYICTECIINVCPLQDFWVGLWFLKYMTFFTKNNIYRATYLNSDNALTLQ